MKKKPVAWMWKFEDDNGAAFTTKKPTRSIKDGVNYIPLYTKPKKRNEGCALCGKLTSDGWVLYCVKCSEPPREWVGLTDDEIYAAIRPLYCDDSTASSAVAVSLDEYRVIEKALKEKNT
jgi:hypothetical protein